jgi:hypothetical protein
LNSEEEEEAEKDKPNHRSIIKYTVHSPLLSHKPTLTAPKYPCELQRELIMVVTVAFPNFLALIINNNQLVNEMK